MHLEWRLYMETISTAVPCSTKNEASEDLSETLENLSETPEDLMKIHKIHKRSS